MFLEFAVGALAVVVAYLGWVVSNDKRMLKFYQESLDFTVVSEGAKVLLELSSIKEGIRTVQLQVDGVPSIHQMMKEIYIPKQATGPLPPANRKPRTEEQKRLAAEVKKAWWASKRAEEESKKAQEQNAITPNVETNVS